MYPGLATHLELWRAFIRLFSLTGCIFISKYIRIQYTHITEQTNWLPAVLNTLDIQILYKRFTTRIYNVTPLSRSLFTRWTFSILMYSNKEVSLPDKNNYVTLYEAIVCGGDDVTRFGIWLYKVKAVIIPF